MFAKLGVALGISLVLTACGNAFSSASLDSTQANSANSGAGAGPTPSPTPIQTAAPTPGNFPGQAGNPVGYAAYGKLGTTAWPGGSFVSGTAANPTVYKNYVFTDLNTISGQYIQFESCDFNNGANPLTVSGSNITFVGSRFQSHSVEYGNVLVTGSNITFKYDSFTPLASLYTAPPGSVWPSAGAGKNTIVQVANVNAIEGNSGYEGGLSIQDGAGSVTVDHSDFWGFGNAIILGNTTAQMTFTSNWIHDAADAVPQQYHTDGIGYLNGGAGPSNILIQGNTIASLGNTNGLAFQQATSGYSNIQVIGNYFAGFGYTTDYGSVGPVHFSNSVVKDNVYGTDIMPCFGPLGDQTQMFQSAGNSWVGNTFNAAPGTVSEANADGFWHWSPSDSGHFIYPDGSFHTTDF